MPPGEKAFGSFWAEELPADKLNEDFAAEEFGQPRVVEPGDLMEKACLVHPALGHQEMEGGVKIHPVPECLNGRDDSRHQLAAGCSLKISGQGPEGRAAE